MWWRAALDAGSGRLPWELSVRKKSAATSCSDKIIKNVATVMLIKLGGPNSNQGVSPHSRVKACLLHNKYDLAFL